MYMYNVYVYTYMAKLIYIKKDGQIMYKKIIVITSYSKVLLKLHTFQLEPIHLQYA